MNLWFKSLLVSLCCSAALLASPARYFDLPAGKAELTLEQFAAQCGVQFVFSVEKVRGIQTQAVKGWFPAPEALERQLAGTRLRMVRDEKTGALTVDWRPPPDQIPAQKKAPR